MGTSNPYCEITLPIGKDEAKEAEGYLTNLSEIKEADIVITLKCTLLEFYFGCIKEIMYSRHELYKGSKNTKEVE